MSGRCDFLKDADGVHAVINEHTVCGVAFDAHESGDSEAGPLGPTTRRTVTCPICAQVIVTLRGVRVARAALREAGVES